MIIIHSRIKIALFLTVIAVLCGTTKMLAQTVKYITPDLLSTTAVYTITEDGTYVLAGGTKTNPKPNADPASVTFAGFIKFTNTVTDATLYLNGFTLRCNAVQHIIQNNGTLTIKGTWPGTGHLNTGGVIAGGNDTFEIEGRAIYNTGKLTIEGISILNCNSGSKDGAGIRNGNRALTITDCTFNNCVTTGRGGAIYSNKGTVTFNSGTIKNCAALNGKGGGIHIEGGKLIMNGGTIRECYARTGGGVYIGNFMDSGVEKSGDFVLNAGTITQCYAVQDRTTNFKDPDSPDVSANRYVGGGVAVLNSDMTMNGGTVSYCYAGSGAGGVYVMSPSGFGEYKSNFYIYDGAKITHCEGYFFGGASHVGQGSTCIMYGGEVSYNICRSGGKDDDGINYSGGGFEVGNAAGSTFDIRGGKVCHNQALGEKIGDKTGYGYGGGIFMRINASGSGGIINLNGGAEISDNYAKHKGGGVYARSDVTVDNANIIHNESGKDGGGIYFENSCSKFSFLSGTISKNISGQNGGALYFDNFGSNKIELVQGTLSNNTATNYGGGAYMVNSKITFGTGANNVSFIKNSATQGGGLYLSSTGTATRDVTIKNSSFIENTASDCGGGIFLNDNGYGTLYLQEGTVYSTNEAANDGGAFYVNKILAVEMENGSFSKNKAINGNGGGMYIGHGNVNLDYGSATGNSAKNGGCFYVNGGDLKIMGGDFSRNHSDNNGGTFYVNGGSTEINDCIIAYNTSSNDGGALYLNGDLKFKSGSLENNNAEHNGGGVYASSGDVEFKGNIISNTALNGGGLYLGPGASMEFQGGLIINNQADTTKTTSVTRAKTAYHGGADVPGWGGSVIEGCGGGIYLQSGTSSENKTTLTFNLDPNDKTFGLYTNTAQKGGDDIVSEGFNTEVILPSVREMQLYGFEGKDATPFWYQDYFYKDKGYDLTNGHAVANDVNYIGRYREMIKRFTNENYNHRVADDAANLDRIKNYYLCLTLSYNMLDITISAKYLLGHETALFRLVRHGGTEDYKYDVLLRGDKTDSTTGKSSRTLRNMPWGTYSIFPNDAWNWAYDKIAPQQNLRLGETGNYEFVFEMNHINGAEVPQHDERQPVKPSGNQ